jgi:hypothetical protein
VKSGHERGRTSASDCHVPGPGGGTNILGWADPECRIGAAILNSAEPVVGLGFIPLTTLVMQIQSHFPTLMISLTPIVPGCLVALVATLGAACGGGGGSDTKTAAVRLESAAVKLERVVDGLAFPLDFAAPPGDRSRQFIAEKGGASACSATDS